MIANRRSFLQWSLGAGSALAALRLGAACGPASHSPAVGPPAAPGGDSEPVRAEVEARKVAPEEPRSILILGGTGFLGPHLVEAAQARGYKVTLFNRGKTNPQLFPDVEKLRGDRDGNLKALAGRRWHAVIDTSGYVPRLVRASAELLAPSVKHYVFISSISVYADFKKRGVAEDHPVATMADETSEDVKQFYGQLKALCEKAAEAAMPGRVTSVRPGLIVGPRDPTDRFTYWPVRVARGGEVLAPGTGDDEVQHIDVRDLAAWIIHVVDKGHVGVYNAVAESMTMRAFLDACNQATGASATFTWVDHEFLDAQTIAPWTDMPMWVPPDGDSAGIGAVDSGKARRDGLGFRPVDDTIRATLEYFRTLPEERRATLRAGITAEREAEVLAAYRASKAKPGKGRSKAKPTKGG